MKKYSFPKRAILAVSASLLAFAACGGASESTKTSDTTVPAVTHRIVSLSPTATEMLYAIGAGDQVVAVDSLSTYPEAVAPKVTKISAYEPSAEAILGYTPDVVLISNDMNKITEQLTAANKNIQVWTGAAASSLADVYKQIEELGTLTGHVKESTDLVQSMKTRIDAAKINIPENASVARLKYYYELDNTYYSVTSNTFIGALLKPMGVDSIADGVESGNDWPQLNAEAIAKANPDVIFLADTKCCAMNAAKVTARAGWATITAVKKGNVVELDDDVASRWGPRVVDLVEAFAAAVNKAYGFNK